MRYHHKHHHVKHHHEEHHERLLKYYKFTETLLGTPTTVNVDTPIAKIRLRKIRSNDRIALKASIQWLSTVAGATVTFKIWRNNISGTPVCTYTDTGYNDTFTTSFSCTDTHVPKGSHNYYLTASIQEATTTIQKVHFEGFVIDENE